MICSDFLSSLSAISNTSRQSYSYPPFHPDLHLCQKNFHMGPQPSRQRGNKNIDVAAKSAAHLPSIQPCILPTQSDLTLSIHHKISELWTSHWQSQKYSNKLATLKPLPIPWASTYQPHRRHEICLTRLTHSHLFPLSCNLCGTNSSLIVKHIFSCHTPPHTAKHTKSPHSYSRP